MRPTCQFAANASTTKLIFRVRRKRSRILMLLKLFRRTRLVLERKTLKPMLTTGMRVICTIALTKKLAQMKLKAPTLPRTTHRTYLL